MRLAPYFCALMALAYPAMAMSAEHDALAAAVVPPNDAYLKRPIYIAAREAAAECEARKPLSPGASVTIQLPLKRCPKVSDFGASHNHYGPIDPSDKAIRLKFRFRY